MEVPPCLGPLLLRRSGNFWDRGMEVLPCLGPLLLRRSGNFWDRGMEVLPGLGPVLLLLRRVHGIPWEGTFSRSLTHLELISGMRFVGSRGGSSLGGAAAYAGHNRSQCGPPSGDITCIEPRLGGELYDETQYDEGHGAGLDGHDDCDDD